MTDCLFCRIVSGEIPAEVVARSERALAFRDIAPQAPTHVLVVPLEHYDNYVAMMSADKELGAELVGLASRVTEIENLSDGHRLIFNTGADGGQTVGHVHAHVIGGRKMAWPPG